MMAGVGKLPNDVNPPGDKEGQGTVQILHCPAVSPGLGEGFSITELKTKWAAWLWQNPQSPELFKSINVIAMKIQQFI